MFFILSLLYVLSSIYAFFKSLGREGQAVRSKLERAFLEKFDVINVSLIPRNAGDVESSRLGDVFLEVKART